MLKPFGTVLHVRMCLKVADPLRVPPGESPSPNRPAQLLEREAVTPLAAFVAKRWR